nr:MAG: hypothetical protein H2Bulk36768_000001 [Mitovirus sp.]
MSGVTLLLLLEATDLNKVAAARPVMVGNRSLILVLLGL